MADDLVLCFLSLFKSVGPRTRGLRLSGFGELTSRSVLSLSSPHDFLESVSRTSFVDEPIFRCCDDWWLINRAGHHVSVSRTAYRRDSRVEVITDNELLDWTQLEAEMTAQLDSK